MNVQTIVQALEVHERGEKPNQAMVKYLADNGYVEVTEVTHAVSPGREYLITFITEKGREIMKQGKENVSDKHTWQSALDSSAIHDSRRFLSEFDFSLGKLSTRIRVRLYAHVDRPLIEYDLSHFIHTPIQAGPYQPSTPFGDDEGDALHQAVFGLTHNYNAAVNAGHTPSESWLVENPDF